MVTIVFPERKATQQVKFCCAKCGKPRTRTLAEGCTVNPWNKDPATGAPLTPAQVQKQADDRLRVTVRRFLVEPLCRACENDASYDEKKAIRARREQGAARCAT